MQAGSRGEQKRFQAILDSDDWQVRIGGGAPFPTAEKITQLCVDNRWRSYEEIREQIEAPQGHETKKIPDVVSNIKRKHTGDLVVMEKRFAGGVKKFRFKKIENKAGIRTSAITVVEELAPIIDDFVRYLDETPPDAVGLIKGQMPRLKKLLKTYS